MAVVILTYDQQGVASTIQLPSCHIRHVSTHALLQTRLHPPLLAADVTPRPRLDTLIQRGVERKLLLVIAPAGYGKTTAMLSWVQQQVQPIAWLSLNAASDDLISFVAYVVAAIQCVAPGACTDSEVLVHSGQAPAAVLLAALVNDLAKLSERVVLVLDDYNSVATGATHAFMAALLDACRRRCT